MTDKIDNLISSDRSIVQSSNLNEEVSDIKKSQASTNSTKPKILNGSKENLKTFNSKIRRVKFKNKVDIVDVECWKMYNADQTADENYDALFTDFEKDDKEKANKDDKNNNKKRNSKKDTVSCSCIII